MATITIRYLDDALIAKLFRRARENSRSIEAEARAIIRERLTGPIENVLGHRLHGLFAEAGSVELGPPDRSAPPRAAKVTA